MDQTFDARFQFHKRTVVHHVDDFAFVDGVDWVLLFDVVPRVWQQLLQAQTDFSFFAVDGQNHDFDLLVHRNHFRWLRDTRVRHVCDVQQTVDAAKVDERTEVGDVLDDTLADLANFQFGHQFLLCVRTFLFDQRTTTDDDVTTLFVDLENFALHDAADVFADVARTADVDLRGRQEDRHADVDQKSAFDFALASTGDDVAFADLVDQVQPFDDDGSFTVADRDQSRWIIGVTLFVFEIFDEHFDGLTDFERFGFFVPFVSRNGAFTFEADVHDDGVFIQSHNFTDDDVADVD